MFGVYKYMKVYHGGVGRMCTAIGWRRGAHWCRCNRVLCVGCECGCDRVWMWVWGVMWGVGWGGACVCWVCAGAEIFV